MCVCTLGSDEMLPARKEKKEETIKKKGGGRLAQKEREKSFERSLELEEHGPPSSPPLIRSIRRRDIGFRLVL